MKQEPAPAARAVGITPNDYVRIKLTDYGRELLRKQHQALNAKLQIPLPGDGVPDEDEQGWSKWHLWWLMRKFGGLGAGSPFAFDDFEICKKV